MTDVWRVARADHGEPDHTMVAIDYDALDLRIVPCRECSPWWAEVVDDGGRTVVREWHLPACSEALDLGPVPAVAPTGVLEPAVERAVGAVAALFGLSSTEARTAVSLRADAASVPVAAMAVRMGEAFRRLDVDEASRARAAALIDSTTA